MKRALLTLAALLLQGVFKVSVDSIVLSLQTVPDGKDPKTTYYCLKLGNIGLKILGIAKLPPNATINFFLFGDPGGTGSLGLVGVQLAQRHKRAVRRNGLRRRLRFRRWRLGKRRGGNEHERAGDHCS